MAYQFKILPIWSTALKAILNHEIYYITTKTLNAWLVLSQATDFCVLYKPPLLLPFLNHNEMLLKLSCYSYAMIFIILYMLKPLAGQEQFTQKKNEGQT